MRLTDPSGKEIAGGLFGCDFGVTIGGAGISRSAGSFSIIPSHLKNCTILLSNLIQNDSSSLGVAVTAVSTGLDGISSSRIVSLLASVNSAFSCSNSALNASLYLLL